MTNEQVLEILKAQFDTSSNGMAAEQDADSFISLAVDQTAVLQGIRVETGIRTAFNLDNLQFGEPILVADTEGQAPSAGDVNKPDHVRKKLQPVEAIAAVDITFSNLRRNIMAGRLNEYLNQEISKRIGKDSVLIAFSGDKGAGSATRTAKAKKILDGFIKQAETDNTVNDANFNKSTAKPTEILGVMLKNMPKDYADQIDQLGYYVSTELYLAYAQEIGARQTASADQILFGAGAARPLYYLGIPVFAVYGMTDERAILTVKENLAIGYGQEMTIGRDVDNRAGLVKITVRLAMDVKYVLGEALVLATHSI